MEASYFYYRPSDLLWTANGKKGDYLDKGFNVKFSYKPKKNFFPEIAIGLDDFAGTGYFTREYIVATNNFEHFKLSYGLGWGMFEGENSFNNPLTIISEKFETRPIESSNKGEGGQPSYDQWFRGNVGLFGGVEFFVPKARGLKLKLEYDPFDYLNFTAFKRNDADIDLRKKDSKINFGLSYPVNDFITIDTSFFKGNTFNISFNLAYNFASDRTKKQKFSPKITSTINRGQKIDFYTDLLNNLNQNNLFLQTANLNNDSLDIAISTSEHRNAIRSSSYAAYIANIIGKNHNQNFSKIKISHINAGVEINKISYLRNYLEGSNKTPIELKRVNTQVSSGNNSYYDHEFQPEVLFPVYFSTIKPTIVSHIGRPDKFYYGGIVLQHLSEIQFSRKLILTSELNYALYNNFNDGLVSKPDSVMRNVRTELVNYLQESELYVSRMQLDYIWSPTRDIYAKVSAGIFEQMYGGAGFEILYIPFNRNFSVGIEHFYVKKRDFDQRFDFLEYETNTGHINFNYQLPLGIDAKLSYGRYLAKDDGFTLDFSKTSRSGFQSGFYFTRTDVPAEIFGEGSFDKGFYFQIPLDLFSRKHSISHTSFKLSPLTRDGGAKLEFGKDLKGLINNASRNKLNQQWSGFLD